MSLRAGRDDQGLGDASHDFPRDYESRCEACGEAEDERADRD